MNKIKAMIVLPFLIVTGVVGCAGKEGNVKGEVIISGLVKNPAAGKITIQEMLPTGEKGPEQEITLKADHTFKKVMAVKNPGYYHLNFFNVKQATVILADSDFEITVDCATPKIEGEPEVTIKGSPDHDLIKGIRNILESKEDTEMNNLEMQFRQASKEGDSDKMAELQQQAQVILGRHLKTAAEFVSKQPVTFATMYVIESYFKGKEQYISLCEKSVAELSKKYPDCRHVKTFVEAFNKEKKLAIGQPAPEISLPGPEGKNIQLSSLRGKYVLLDFWASWCGPCRRENPNVVAAYNKFKDKGFEVYGVSLDRNKEDWVKAIAQDRLTYIHVSDLKYFESAAARTYNIDGIPMCYLIDPKGNIAAKNLRGPLLEETLEKVLK